MDGWRLIPFDVVVVVVAVPVCMCSVLFQNPDLDDASFFPCSFHVFAVLLIVSFLPHPDVN